MSGLKTIPEPTALKALAAAVKLAVTMTAALGQESKRWILEAVAMIPSSASRCCHERASVY